MLFFFLACSSRSPKVSFSLCCARVRAEGRQVRPLSCSLKKKERELRKETPRWERQKHERRKSEFLLFFLSTSTSTFFEKEKATPCLSLFYTLSLPPKTQRKNTHLPPCALSQHTECKKNRKKEKGERRKEKKTLRFRSVKHFGVRVFREQLRFEGFEVRPRLLEPKLLDSLTSRMRGQPLIRKSSVAQIFLSFWDRSRISSDELEGVESIGHCLMFRCLLESAGFSLFCFSEFAL